MASAHNIRVVGGYHDLRRHHRRGAIRQAIAALNWRDVAWLLIVAAVIIGCGLMWGSEPDAENVERPVYVGATTVNAVDAGVDTGR
ncbi:MAG: hypothetical protein ABFD54_04345 [Armatimonadota bacterium]